MASIGPILKRFALMRFTVTVWRPSGLGRSAERVAIHTFERKRGVVPRVNPEQVAACLVKPCDDNERVTNSNSVEGSCKPREELEPGVWRTFATLFRRPHARFQPRLKDSDWAKSHVQPDTGCSVTHVFCNAPRASR